MKCKNKNKEEKKANKNMKKMRNETKVEGGARILENDT